LAGVDVGTLTCRLLIGRVSGNRLTELFSQRRILRLGEGVQRTSTLQESAMSRVLATLADWRQVIAGHHVDGEVAVATSAVRDARNREEFLRRAKRETGFEVEVLTGQEEARRTLLGIRSGLPPTVHDVVALDIGGGSTEVILHRPGHAPVIRSLDLGVVRLTESTLRDDPPSPEAVRRARAIVSEMAGGVAPALGHLSQATLVGTAGTVTTLAAMAQELPHYQPARIHNFSLGLTRIIELEERLLRYRKPERTALVGLEPGREEVIVAGTIILRGVMETLGFRDCLVSDLGLREGIVLDLAARLAARA
jgi:exopolyphosphatase/guanosine-5'-triphosphate,3'-diphosphate pyrophosphatase